MNDDKKIIGAAIQKDGAVPYLRIEGQCYSAIEVIDLIDIAENFKSLVSRIVVIESQEENGGEWFVSFNGSNPTSDYAIRVHSKDDAFNLTGLLTKIVHGD